MFCSYYKFFFISITIFPDICFLSLEIIIYLISVNQFWNFSTRHLVHYGKIFVLFTLCVGVHSNLPSAVTEKNRSSCRHWKKIPEVHITNEETVRSVICKTVTNRGSEEYCLSVQLKNLDNEASLFSPQLVVLTYRDGSSKDDPSQLSLVKMTYPNCH